jgi:hypothetical protein
MSFQAALALYRKKSREDPSMTSRSLTTTARSSQASLFDLAKKTLAEAKTLREVKDIADKAASIKEYARRAKDKALIEDATSLKMDAERKVGEMMAEMRETGQMNRGSRNSFRGRDSSGEPVRGLPENRPTLRQSGVDHHLAERARRLAQVPSGAYERMRSEASQRASRRVETHEPRRALSHPIRVPQYALVVMEGMAEKIKVAVEGRKMESLVSMRDEFTEATREEIERHISESIEKLKRLKKRLFSEAEIVQLTTDRRR